MKGKVMPTPHESCTPAQHRSPALKPGGKGDGDAVHLTRRSNVERRTWNVEARPGSGSPGSGGCAGV